jgi:hypothetical protein
MLLNLPCFLHGARVTPKLSAADCREIPFSSWRANWLILGIIELFTTVGAYFATKEFIILLPWQAVVLRLRFGPSSLQRLVL